ncbi:MAG: hypothetical protein OEL87_00005, partial [Nanoarchaeota archaeon]|nr:hypothetical protein [Nanoarchaeota archaeon]
QALWIFLLVGAVIIFGNADTGSLFGSGSTPAYVWSKTTTSSGCSDAGPYTDELKGYKSKVHVGLVNTPDEEQRIQDSDRFVWDVGFRTTRESQGRAGLDGGVPAQLRCTDNKYDCNFEISPNVNWELVGDKCFVKKAPEPSSTTITLPVDRPVALPNNGDNSVNDGNLTDTGFELSFFQKIKLWFLSWFY